VLEAEPLPFDNSISFIAVELISIPSRALFLRPIPNIEILFSDVLLRAQAIKHVGMSSQQYQKIAFLEEKSFPPQSLHPL
jgi:hypothetical protein